MIIDVDVSHFECVEKPASRTTVQNMIIEMDVSHYECVEKRVQKR
jgi:hypothetical protein